MSKMQPRPPIVHPSHQMHPNSLLSFEELEKRHRPRTTKEAILAELKGNVLSRPDLAERTGKEINCITYPVKLLIEKGVIVPVYRAINPRTGFWVDYLALAEEIKPAQLVLF